MRKANLILLALVSAVRLGGRNTVEGVGKDIKQGGEAIERAAKKKQMEKFNVLNGIVAPLDRDQGTARAASRARAAC